MTSKVEQVPGIQFVLQTALNRNTIRSLKRPETGQVTPYKSYPGSEKIILPRTLWRLTEARILNLLQQRRSIRSYSEDPLSIEDLAFILWASQGVTAQAGNHLLRTAPSAGALYPIETYLSIQNVQDLKPGLYHFDVRYFQLELISAGNASAKLARGMLDQHFIEHAAVCLIWSAVVARSLGKYGDRAIRYLMLDAAHICQNSLLAAEAVQCGSCPVAAFYDDEINDLLGLDGVDEMALYGAVIGKKQPGKTVP